MKKIIFFLLISLLLVNSCSKRPEKQQVEQQEQQVEQTQEQQELVFKSIKNDDLPPLQSDVKIVKDKQFLSKPAVQVGDCIYYTGYRTNWLAKSKADGTNHSIVYRYNKTEYDELSGLAYYDGYVYFNTPSCYARISVDTNEVTFLNIPRNTDVVISNGFIYYEDGEYFYRVRCADLKSQKIIENTSKKGVMWLDDVDEDYIYFNYNDCKYRSRLDGSDIVEFNPEQRDIKYKVVKAFDGYVYYLYVENDIEYLKRCKNDYSDCQTVYTQPDDSSYGFNFDNGYVYFYGYQYRVKLDGTGFEQMYARDTMFLYDTACMLDVHLIGDYVYIEVQVDDANWYDLVRYPKSEFLNKTYKNGQHTLNGEWVSYNKQVYDSWYQEFITPKPYY